MGSVTASWLPGYSKLVSLMCVNDEGGRAGLRDVLPIGGAGTIFVGLLVLVFTASMFVGLALLGWVDGYVVIVSCVLHPVLSVKGHVSTDCYRGGCGRGIVGN